MDKQLLYQKLFDVKSDCLSEEQLLDYVQGNLSHKEQHQVETHLLSCDLCDEAVEGLLLLEQERRVSIISTLKKNILKRTENRNYWAWAAIFSGIFISISSIFYFTNTLDSSADSKAMAYEEAMSPTMESAPTSDKEETVEVAVTEESYQPQSLDQNKKTLLSKETKKEYAFEDLKVTDNIQFDTVVLEPVYTLSNTSSSNFNSIEEEIEVSEDPTILDQKDYHRKLLEVNKNQASGSSASDKLDQEFNIQKTAVNDDAIDGEMMEEEIVELNDMATIDEIQVETIQKKTKTSLSKKKDKSESKRGSLYKKEDEKKSVDLTELSKDMKNIAFSKIKDDSSTAYYQLTQHNYKEAYSLYQKALNTDPKNNTLIYKTALAGLFHNIDLKEVEDLIDEIDHTEKGKWLKASIYLSKEKEKKAKKILKELADTQNIFQKNAQNILLNLE